ncbi:glutamate ligase domain-containing protein [Armatimonas rosea]|uniref:tetrahydrofolate synthase n=1 Tax=Armatimonas rosea TaxID=685828 RepID=A0A7W9W9S7_ARMRO|nr:dihydrofolate synthase/folylpolyglutamate synthase [Armatimonas rosea]
MTFDQAVGYLANRITFSPRKDPARLRALLAEVGSPQDRLPCVHIAGTNGKGSVTTMTAAILQAAGYTVGAYLSPYVFSLGERWQVNGLPLSEEALARHVTELAPFVERISAGELGAITEFELKTAIAFKHFAEVGVDFAVIEVGIGGTYDSTNIIPPPLAAAITSIGFDHMALLGNTLGEIAAQKAGILKHGTRACITPVTDPEALAAIQQKATSEGVPLTLVRGDELPGGITLALRGPHQRVNASTATLLARTLELPESAIRAGLESATLPGRFQLCLGGRLILDGAHNEDGAQTLVAALTEEFPGEKFVFVIGSKQTHSPAPFLAELAPLAAAVIATEPSFKPTPAREVVAAAQRLGLPVTHQVPVAAAIEAALQRTERVVVTGSFYVVGETPVRYLAR